MYRDIYLTLPITVSIIRSKGNQSFKLTSEAFTCKITTTSSSPAVNDHWEASHRISKFVIYQNRRSSVRMVFKTQRFWYGVNTLATKVYEPETLTIWENQPFISSHVALKCCKKLNIGTDMFKFSRTPINRKCTENIYIIISCHPLVWAFIDRKIRQKNRNLHCKGLGCTSFDRTATLIT